MKQCKTLRDLGEMLMHLDNEYELVKLEDMSPDPELIDGSIELSYNKIAITIRKLK